MSAQTYSLGWRYSSYLTYPISYTLDRGVTIPSITGPSVVHTGETITLTVDDQYYAVESISVTNATGSVSGDTITISNPTGEVSIGLTVVYRDSLLCTLRIQSRGGGETAARYSASYINSGTITYLNKYGETAVIDCSTLDLALVFAQTYKYVDFTVVVDSDITCSNIGLGYVNITNADLRMRNNGGTSTWDYTITLYKNSTPKTATFSIEGVEKFTAPDIVIESTRG